MMSQAARIEEVAPGLRVLVKQYNDGTFPEGDEALNKLLTDTIKDAKLSEVKKLSIEKLGCFPGNRFKAGLIAVDMHYVLKEGFFQNGWNPQKWECMALTVPPSKKEEWTAVNHQLVKQANGLLPSISDIEHVTGRGSHGTSALRAGKYGCKAICPKSPLADQNGNVSYHKLVEKQPSMKSPMDDGVDVTVMPGELELAVPGLFSVLSEVGNVSNSVYRLNTTLQIAVRIHQMALQHEDDPDWDLIAKQAGKGMHRHEADQLSDLCSFVKEWSGGADGNILQELEAYEKTLDVRRKISFKDLGKLAECRLDDYPHIVPAA
jgi:hypothetical protein